MRFLIPFLLAASLAAQVIVSTSSITVQRVGGPGVGRIHHEARRPLFTISTASGSMAWTSAITGTLSTSCNGGGACFYLALERGMAAVTSGTATTTPATYSLRFFATSPLAVGAYTGTLTITPASGPPSVVSVTLNIVNDVEPRPRWLYKTGYPVGCTNSHASWPTTDTCTVSRMPMNTETKAATGATRVDQSFGHTVRYLFPYGCQTVYGGVRAFSAANTYVFASGMNGFTGCGVRRMSDGAVIRDYSTAMPTGFNPEGQTWSAIEDGVIYFIPFTTPTQIRRWDVVANTVTTIADFAARGLTNLRTGGQFGGWRDDWWAVLSGSGGTLEACMVDLQGLRRGLVTAATVPCVSLAGYTPDFIAQGPLDKSDNTRYAFAEAASRGNLILSLPAGSNSIAVRLMPDKPEQAVPLNEDEICQAEENCTGDGHGTIFERRGIANIWMHNADFTLQSCTPTCAEAYAASRINAVSKSYTSLFGFSPTTPGRSVAQQQSSYPAAYNYELNKRLAGKVGTAAPTGGDPTSTTITVVDAQTSPAAITGWTVGQQVRITDSAGGTFAACLDGLRTIASVTGNTLVLSGTDCSAAGSYTASSAWIGSAAAPNSGAYDNWLSLHGPGWIRPIASLRNSGWFSVPTSNGAAPPYVFSYLYSSRCSVSWDEALIACNTNDGFLDPGGIRVVVYETGYGISQRSTIKSIDAGDTFAIVRFDQPVSRACTVDVWPSPSAFGAPLATGSATAQSGAIVLTGLTANSAYVARLSCADSGEDLSFRTGATITGTGTFRASKGGGGSVAYGTTPALGSSCTSPCAASVSRGLLYTEVGPVVVR